MNCPTCKSSLADDVDICSTCGTDVENLRRELTERKTRQTVKPARVSSGEPQMSSEERRKLQRAYLVCGKCGTASWQQYAIRIESQIPGLMDVYTTDSSTFAIDPAGVCIVSRGYLPDVWTKVTSAYAADPSAKKVYCKTCDGTQSQYERLLQPSQVKGKPRVHDGTPRESGTYEDRVKAWETSNTKFGLGCALPVAIVGLMMGAPYLGFFVVVPWWIYHTFIAKPKD